MATLVLALAINLLILVLPQRPWSASRSGARCVRARSRAAPMLGSIGMAAAALMFAAPDRAAAGPPFLTDDPEPTDAGHWEIYAPALDASGRGRDYDGSLGVELNYGAAPNIQVTVGLPAAYVQDADGFRNGRGDLELSVKYRFFHDEAAGLSIATFPGITVPTASHGLRARRATALLPVWAQKDAGPWSLFGGGGYAINPGPGNRDYWTGGVAVSRQVSDGLLLGVEVDRQGADTVDGRASTNLGLGAILQLWAPSACSARPVPPTLMARRRLASMPLLRWAWISSGAGEIALRACPPPRPR